MTNQNQNSLSCSAIQDKMQKAFEQHSIQSPPSHILLTTCCIDCTSDLIESTERFIFKDQYIFFKEPVDLISGELLRNLISELNRVDL